MPRAFALLCFHCLLAGAALVPAVAEVAECEASYERVRRSGLSAVALAERMEKVAPQCLRTGMFDVRVAFALLEGGQVARAVAVAEKALSSPAAASAKPNLLQVLAQAALVEGNVELARKRGLEIEREFPRYAPIQGLLGTIAVKQQQWELALVHSQRAYELEGTVAAQLAMAAVLHQLDRHEETVRLVYEALEREPQRIARVTGVLEAIYSLAILKRRPEAAALARRHIAANPEWRSNTPFARAAVELGVAPQ